jgi:hypothetical protein
LRGKQRRDDVERKRKAQATKPRLLSLENASVSNKIASLSLIRGMMLATYLCLLSLAQL